METKKLAKHACDKSANIELATNTVFECLFVIPQPYMQPH